jgi:hypothetical protein
VSLQADFSKVTGASSFTVAFNLQPQGIQAGNAFYMAEAIIQMTVAGNTIQRRMNIMNGASFSGVAEAVRVIVYDTTPTDPTAYPASIQFPAGQKYLVTVTVARGTRPGRIVPPILMPPPSNFGAAQNNAPGNVLLNNANMQFVVPTDAGITSMLALVSDESNAFGSAGDHSNQLLLFFQGGGGPIAGYYPAQYQSGAWIPVPPGTVVIFGLPITGGGATSTLSVTCYYGIDG